MNTQDARRLVQAEGYLELDLPDEARKCLAQVGEEVRRSYEWNVIVAETHRVSRQFADALRHYEAAHRLKPQDISVHVNMGWCLKRLHRVKDAVEVLRRADEICDLLKRESEHPLIRYNLSCYYSLLLDKEQMLDWLRRALEMDPSYAALITNESDFDPFRNDPDFQRLVASVVHPS